MGVLLAITITVLDSSMVNVALPAIALQLAIDPGSVVWVSIAYNLTVVVSLLPLSAVAERIGFRRMFASGLTLFLLSSIVAVLSTSLVSLTVARVAQGFGSCNAHVFVWRLGAQYLPAAVKLGMGISVNAMVVGLMAVVGPTVGAFILQIASWQWIFVVNIPIGIATYFCIRFLPEVPRNNVALRLGGLRA